MSENSSIEWTDHTFNTHWGCSKISPGCDGCYAETLARRFGYGWGDAATKREFGESHWNDLLRWDRKAAAEGVRRRVFTNSMSDLFDRFAPCGVRERHWEFVARTTSLDHLLLTKRIGNVRRMCQLRGSNLAAGRRMSGSVQRSLTSRRQIGISRNSSICPHLCAF